MLEYAEETICLTTDEMRVALIFQLPQICKTPPPISLPYCSHLQSNGSLLSILLNFNTNSTINSDYFNIQYYPSWASLVAQVVKNLPAMPETWVWFLCQEYPLEKGMAIHSDILAWRIPWTEEPGGLQSIGLQTQWVINIHFSMSLLPLHFLFKDALILKHTSCTYSQVNAHNYTYFIIVTWSIPRPTITCSLSRSFTIYSTMSPATLCQCLEK